MLWVVDVDGSVADYSHRTHFVSNGENDWNAFVAPENVAKDVPIPGAVEALRRICARGDEVRFLTGRSESLRSVTERWILSRVWPLWATFWLTMRGPEWEGVSATDFKSSVVKALIKRRMFSRRHDVVLVDDDAIILDKLSILCVTLKAPECWPLVCPPCGKNDRDVAWRV